MKISKAQMISLLFLLIAGAAFGGFYQFYLKAKLQEYRNNQVECEKLKEIHTGLNTTFEGVRAEVYASAWSIPRQPLSNALDARTKYFNLSNWHEHQPLPKEGALKFWYDDEVNRVLWAIDQKANETIYRNGYREAAFPENLRQELGIPTLNDWKEKDIKESDVVKALETLTFGVKVCELLMDAEAATIEKVTVWPPQKETPVPNGLGLTRYSSGVSFSITAKSLVKLMEKLRLADRFFTVEGTKITYPYVMYESEPELRVEMIFTQCAIDVSRAKDGTSSAEQLFKDAAKAKPAASPTTAQEQELGVLMKAWKWFKAKALLIPEPPPKREKYKINFGDTGRLKNSE